MREFKDHVKTSIVLKENVLKLVLTNANHIYVEAEDGWLYRGRRYRYTAHVTFNGQEWVLQPDLGSSAVCCPDGTPAGQKAMTANMLLALNTVVGNVEWFQKLRAEAEAVNANNNIWRADEKIADLEKTLRALRDQRETFMVTEANALSGMIPPAYVKE